MNSIIRPRRLAAAALLLALGGASACLSSANADDPTARTHGGAVAPTAKDTGASPAGARAHGLILGSRDGAQPKNMEQFLTAVTKDVDAYWSKTFKASGLPEPTVSYKWIAAGQTAASACGDENGTLGDTAAAYCPGDDTLYISEKFATDVYDGALDQALPGSSHGYGRTIGDFSVAYIVAHEYGHEVQDELGVFDRYGGQLPTMAFELQADCYAGTWANSAAQDGRLEDGDVQEALDAALAVGDFDTANPSHHGTPEQREQAWKTGFDGGDPGSCSTYLDSATLADGSAAPRQDSGSGDVQPPDSAFPGNDTGYGALPQETGDHPAGVTAARASA